MTTDPAHDPHQEPEREAGTPSAQPLRMPLPGVAAIGLYLMLMAAAIVFAVVKGEYPRLYLLFSAAFIMASAGLVASFRWAWSLTLATVFLLASYWAWMFSRVHSGQAAIQGLFNLLFFLYLVRPEVRSRLR